MRLRLGKAETGAERAEADDAAEAGQCTEADRGPPADGAHQTRYADQAANTSDYG